MKNIKTIEELIQAAKGGNDPDLEKKSNETVSTTNNAEWYDAYGVISEVRDLTGKAGQLMPKLSEGFLGSNLPESFPVPYDITDVFMKGKTEWPNSANPSNDAQAITSNKSTLSQANLALEINISDEEIKHSSDKQLREKLIKKMVKAAVRTQESMIINGDNEAGGTGNVNSDDQAASTTYGSAAYHSLLLDHGIREAAINNSNHYDVDAFDSDDIMTVVTLLAERYQDFPEDILLIANTTTKNKMLTDDAFKLAYNTSRPSIDGGTPNPFGYDMIHTSLVPLTEADGKVHSSAGNNTKGQFLAVFTPAIFHGYGMDVKVEIERVYKYGYRLHISMQWGFVILDYANTCAAGRNVAL